MVLSSAGLDGWGERLVVVGCEAKKMFPRVFFGPPKLGRSILDIQWHDPPV